MSRLFVLLIAGIPSMALGDAIVDVVTVTAPAKTSYDYRVTASGPENIFEFTLFVNGVILTPSISAPPGWTVNASLSVVDWFASDASFDVLAGSSLSGFDFDSLQMPDTAATFDTIGFDSQGNVVVFTAATTGPTVPVPEATGLQLVVLGLSALIVAKVFQSRPLKTMISRARTPRIMPKILTPPPKSANGVADAESCWPNAPNMARLKPTSNCWL